jgi:aspartate racemase
MHTRPLSDYIEALDAANWQRVAGHMLESAQKLAAAGANILICPDNTLHQALPLVEPRSPIPWLHIAEVVTDEARARGFRKLGLLGTRWLVGSGVYPEKLAAQGLACEYPDHDEIDEIHRIIMDELVCGVFKPEQVQYHRKVIIHMKERGCDAAILGCTEIPLIMNDENSPLPTLDSTRLLARAALRRASGGS